MYWKSLMIFLSICFIVLISLDAIAHENAPSLKIVEINIKIGGQKAVVTSQENTSAEVQACAEAKKPAIRAESKIAILNKPATYNANFSFNFIYYIIYKFKYIDSFGLSTPERSTPSDKENITWQ